VVCMSTMRGGATKWAHMRTIYAFPLPPGSFG